METKAVLDHCSVQKFILDDLQYTLNIYRLSIRHNIYAYMVEENSPQGRHIIFHNTIENEDNEKIVTMAHRLMDLFVKDYLGYNL